ncbi:unnamed protein product [Ixodes pacificus]
MTGEALIRLVGQFAGSHTWSTARKLSWDCAQYGDQDKGRALDSLGELERAVDKLKQEREGACLYRRCELECKTINLVIQEKDLGILKKRLSTIEAKADEVLPKFHAVKENYLRIHSAIKEQTQRLKELKQAAQARKSALSELEEALLACKAKIIKERLSRERCLERESAAREELALLAGKEAEIAQMEVALGNQLGEVCEALSDVEEEQGRLNRRYLDPL